MNELNSISCKFTAQIKQQQGQYLVEIPEQEIQLGTLSESEICQISIHQCQTESATLPTTETQEPSPPVSEGEQRTVEIEDRGDQGDGIARVDRGYVVIVPDTEPEETVRVEIKQVNQRYGFAEVIDSETKNNPDADDLSD